MSAKKKPFNAVACACRVAKLPPVKLRAACERLITSELRDVEKILECIAESTVAVAAYVGERYGYGCGDQGHESGVKKFNQRRKRVRSVMGYCTTSEIRF